MRYFNIYPWQRTTRNLRLSVKFNETFSAKKLQDDFQAVARKFGSSRQHDVYHSGGWNAICLNALDGRVDADWAGEDNCFYEKTPALNEAPYINSIIDSFQCEKKRIRLLGLPPGENIYWHSDRSETYHSGTVRLHIPIYTNDRVKFQISHENQVWRPGELWYGDFSFPHRLRNDGDTNRVHLVMDLVLNDWLAGKFPDYIREVKENRDDIREKCIKQYKYYDLLFSAKRYWRSMKQKPRRIFPKALELAGLKKRTPT